MLVCHQFFAGYGITVNHKTILTCNGSSCYRHEFVVINPVTGATQLSLLVGIVGGSNCTCDTGCGSPSRGMADLLLAIYAAVTLVVVIFWCWHCCSAFLRQSEGATKVGDTKYFEYLLNSSVWLPLLALVIIVVLLLLCWCLAGEFDALLGLLSQPALGISAICH